MPLALSVGISHPLKKQRVEVGPSRNGGRKRSPLSSKGGFSLACIILVTENTLVSLDFITAPKSLDDPSRESWVLPPSPIEVTHGTHVKCMFNFVG